MNYKYWLTIIIRISPLVIFLFLFVLGTININAEEEKININRRPHGYLFKVNNLKPGDWMPREITIQNDGKQSFKYTAKIEKFKSIRGLFEELELIIKKEQVVLYQGKFKDFKGFTPRKLAMGAEETFLFQVTMPYELGNEFQGSSAEVEIIFLAERTDGTDPIVNNETPSLEGSNGSGRDTNNLPPSNKYTVTPEVVNKLPNTATDNYNHLLIGVFLVATGSFIWLLKSKYYKNLEKA